MTSVKTGNVEEIVKVDRVLLGDPGPDYRPRREILGIQTKTYESFLYVLPPPLRRPLGERSNQGGGGDRTVLEEDRCVWKEEGKQTKHYQLFGLVVTEESDVLHIVDNRWCLVASEFNVVLTTVTI